jgi:cyclomaltodextrinase / maltogenic alpha-amylase / neopullulanase
MVDPRRGRPTIADVAAAAGVSKTAVSFAFNRPDRLAAGTVTRIRAAADELGYRPDPAARLLGRRRAAGSRDDGRAAMPAARSASAGGVDTPDWVRDAVFYEIFPDRFASSRRVAKPGRLESWDSPPTVHGFKGGDLLGIAERLPELSELGITALYLTPVFASAANHRYHTDDYRSVDPLLGGDGALRELLDEAHGRGMRVILDGVFNHCGRGFWPFHHVVENGSASPYRDWFHLDPVVLAGERQLDAYPDRGASLIGDRPLGYAAWWGLPALPKLAVETPEVREHLLATAEHWLRFGTDGWRLDVPAEIDDAAFWREFRRRCRAVRGDAYLVGEIWDEAPDWLRGDRFDALMNYPLGAAILGFASGGQLDRSVIDVHDTYRRTIHGLDGNGFARRLEHLMSTYDPAVTAVQLNLIGSHDAPRALTVLGGDRAALRLAMLLQLTLPGAPCIYYGDEIGLEGGNDPACRGAFPADPTAGDRVLRGFVRAVLDARHANVALRRGTVRAIATTGAGLALLREADGARAIVVANAGRHPDTLDLELPRPAWRRLRILDLPGWRSPRLDAGGEAAGDRESEGDRDRDGYGDGPGGTTGMTVPGSGRLSLTVPAQTGLILVESPDRPRR